MALHPLRQHRLDQNWSQYHLSFLTGVPQVRISYAERGYPALTPEQKKRIAKILQTAEKDLFPIEWELETNVGS